MFDPIEIPYESKMLFNVVTLKDDADFDEVEMAIGEMCNLVKNTYPGFLCGQVFQFSGFVSEEGTIGTHDKEGSREIAIVTYWRSFEEHEQSHRDMPFKQAFSELEQYCLDTKELGYDLLWQGAKET